MISTLYRTLIEIPKQNECFMDHGQGAWLWSCSQCTMVRPKCSFLSFQHLLQKAMCTLSRQPWLFAPWGLRQHDVSRCSFQRGFCPIKSRQCWPMFKVHMMPGERRGSRHPSIWPGHHAVHWLHECKYAISWKGFSDSQLADCLLFVLFVAFSSQMYKQLIVVEKSCQHLRIIYSRSKTLGIQGSSACARALILSFAHINSWGKVTRRVTDRNGMVFGTSTLHSKKWSLCSTDIHLKNKGV